jgi:hypothetical protein
MDPHKIHTLQNEDTPLYGGVLHLLIAKKKRV